jgi:hypothetical protein
MKRFIERFGLLGFIASTMGGKYMAGISTAGSMGANKVARNLACIARDSSTFQRGYVSGALGVGIKGGSIKDNPKALKKARELGRKLCIDIKKSNPYRFQNVFGRAVNSMFVKPRFVKVLSKNKDGSMKAAYDGLAARGLI